MAAAVSRLLASRPLRQRLATAGLVTAQDFDYRLGVQDVRGVYHGILAKT